MGTIAACKQQFNRINPHQRILIQRAAVNDQQIGRLAFRQTPTVAGANRLTPCFKRHAQNSRRFKGPIKPPTRMQGPKQPDFAERIIILIKGLAINAHRHLAAALQHLGNRRDTGTECEVRRCIGDDSAAGLSDHFQLIGLGPNAMRQGQAW